MLETLPYSAGLAAVPVLLFLYILLLIYLNSILRHVDALLPIWLHSKSGKEHVVQVDTLENLSDESLPTTIRYPSSWWTGNELYKLERRALFSKVSHPSPSLHMLRSIWSRNGCM